ncbi:KPN_02809 family neutral zinc metallopeptidase [Spirosoma validum]|uniref:Neutral zinc metallopeptidase n=1 Tax=Spirosoma validum TaxID=2771355 RepID=A0A927B5E3_9BACT|nr:neutral zinc metallopeptidase [Spirosoma validum]MBD2755961.1 neutral zinc metallopeptidase [Spirosoma validum]
MRWLGGRESDNVDDRRGSGGGGMLVGGGIGTVVIAVIVMLLGGNPSDILNQDSSQQAAPVNQQADDKAAQFTKRTLASTEDVWTKLFAEQGSQYRKPVLVLFRGVTSSGCGTAQKAMGPFYCPLDQKVYIDLSFYDDLAERFQAPGDLAMAYVIAHEIGHHVQKQLGIMDKTDELRQRLSEREYNRVSVRLELQADFFAGVWAHHAQGQSISIDENDVESALTAANAIGDDKIQKETQGQVVPDAFTHGSSAQRVYWFKKGLKTGDINQGDTFNSREDANL